MGATKHGADEVGGRVVIHVGPHKTGTKSLQYSLQSQKSLLERDGWTMPRPKIVTGSNLIARLYTGKSKSVKSEIKARRNWLDLIAQVNGTATNVVLSSEHFNVAGIDGVKQLASDLSHIPTRIVMFYRPFYDWISSMFREKLNGNDWNYVEWLFAPASSKYGTTQMESNIRGYVTALYSRFSAYFSDVQVHAMGDNPPADMACDDLNATRTCAVFRTSEMEHKHVSPRVSSSGECLSPLQLRKLENISIELHKQVFGSYASFPTSEFNAMALDCFGN